MMPNQVPIAVAIRSFRARARTGILVGARPAGSGRKVRSGNERPSAKTMG